MGVGHVPQDPIHSVGSGPQFQGRQRRGTPVGRNPGPGSSLAARRLARARWAERLVADHYQREGFDVIARNWTMRGGELDVVARRGSLIIVCEVKARATAEFGTPAEAMSPTKQRRVRRAGFAFVRTLDEGGLRVRFDLACVLGTALEMHHDAF